MKTKYNKYILIIIIKTLEPLRVRAPTDLKFLGIKTCYNSPRGARTLLILAEGISSLRISLFRSFSEKLFFTTRWCQCKFQLNIGYVVVTTIQSICRRSKKQEESTRKRINLSISYHYCILYQQCWRKFLRTLPRFLSMK